MWISRSEYDRMVTQIANARQRDGRNGHRIAELERKVAILTDELNAYKRQKEEKIFEICFGIRGDKTLKYIVDAETNDEAREIALETFLQNNKNFTKSDINLLFIHEHI